jgi:hypothetical protein
MRIRHEHFSMGRGERGGHHPIHEFGVLLLLIGVGLGVEADHWHQVLGGREIFFSITARSFS